MANLDWNDVALHGDDMQMVEIALEPGKALIADTGAMNYMEMGIEMEAVFGDGSAKSQSKGFLGKMASAAGRALSGEGLFLTQFTNQAAAKKKIAFAAPYPGKIIALDLAQCGGKVVCQRGAFLVAEKGTQVEMEFKRKIGVGFFGGEGFILQRLVGNGAAFMHAGGTVVEWDLAAGESIKLDTGSLVGFTGNVSYDIEMNKGFKNIFFGGEGLFLTTMTGPGKIWIQSLPFTRLAAQVNALAPKQ